jgi:hypothetical protein
MKTFYVRSNRKLSGRLVAALIIPALLLCTLVGCAPRIDNILTQNISEPLDGAATAQVDINTASGNLAIDRLTGGEQLLVTGALEYTEGQGLPTRSVTTSSGQAALNLKSGEARKSGFRLPWEACSVETNWQIYLNPGVAADITAHSGGGNVRLNLSGMHITRLAADTGGGNLDVVLPDSAANLNVTAKTGAGNVAVKIGALTGNSAIYASSGAGNVEVRLPGRLAARIHLSSGMGKATVDPRFSKIDDSTYQSPDYDGAADTVEITLKSGAGNVSIITE